MSTPVQVGVPLRHKGLCAFPLFTEDHSTLDYVLANEAIEHDSILVKEVSESGSVPELLVENKSDSRVLFLEGEELVGAKQNRILNTTVLVPAHRTIKIPVSCVEQGRWRYRSRRFGSSRRHSSSSLRYHLARSVHKSLASRRGHRGDQGKVWEEVQRQQTVLGASSETRAMSDTFASLRQQVAEFQERLSYVPGASGLAVAVGDKVVSLDLLDKPSTCKKVWSRLLSGCVLDTLERAETDNRVEADDIDDFVAILDRAPWRRCQAAGEGVEYRAETHDGRDIYKLVLEGTLVHARILARV